ncbi:MAG TPA: hypothetical protein VI248_09150 [Kineosporiaceae bacterium]
MTLLAAENDPIRSGRWAYGESSFSRASRSMCPSSSAGISTTSAIVSRQASSLEWCS